MASKNKLFKGAVIGAVGVGLLAGGFGTFALWSDSVTLPSATVATGTLDVAEGSRTYSSVDGNGLAGTWDPATDKMVPGDTVIITTTATVTAVGKNLAGDITVAFPDESTFLSTYVGQMSLTKELTSTALGVVPADDALTMSFDPADVVSSAGSIDVTAVITVTLAQGATAQAAQTLSAALTGATVTAQQKLP